MYSLNQLKTLVSCGRDPARSLPFRRGFLLIPLILACFAFSPKMQAAPAPETPDPGAVGGVLNTADGLNALRFQSAGLGNSAFGAYSQFSNVASNFNTAVGAGSLDLNQADFNTACGTAALLLNGDGTRNTAVGTDALLFSGFGVSGANDNDAFGMAALENNSSGFENNAMGSFALFSNSTGADNTALGDLALAFSDFSLGGTANFNTAVGAGAMIGNDGGGQNTVVGAEAGPNLINGFSNTYVGQFVGSNGPIPDEDLTIRIADFSIDGFGSAECFIGGIWNNFQPDVFHGGVDPNIVVVTLNLADDHLGWEVIVSPNEGGSIPSVPSRGAPAPRSAPVRRERPLPQHQAMLNGKVENLEATVAQQQKQIGTLTAQLKEQAAQIQKVSAELEMVRPTPRVVENR
jgi:hypothetical protein